MRRLLIFLLALGLLLGAFAPVAAQGSGRAPEDAADRGRSEEVRSERHGHGPRLGEFEETSPTRIDGDFVAFSWSTTGLTNFTVNGTPLFDIEASGESDGETDVRILGSLIRVDGGTFRLQAHDTPTGVLTVTADDTIRLRLVPGAVVTAVGDHLLVQVGDVSGRVFGDDVAHENGTITADGKLRFLLSTPLAPFDTERETLSRAAAERKIGAEISLAKGKRHDIFEFGNVTARILRSPAEGAKDLLVQVDGHGFDGRVIVLNVDGSLFGATRADKLAVQFDNETITMAEGGLADALDPDDDGLQPEYWLGYDVATEGFQMVVSVPHYSVHEIRVASLIAEAPPSVVIGIAAAVVAIGAASVVMLRPRREE